MSPCCRISCATARSMRHRTRSRISGGYHSTDGRARMNRTVMTSFGYSLITVWRYLPVSGGSKLQTHRSRRDRPAVTAEKTPTNRRGCALPAGCEAKVWGCGAVRSGHPGSFHALEGTLEDIAGTADTALRCCACWGQRAPGATHKDISQRAERGADERVEEHHGEEARRIALLRWTRRGAAGADDVVAGPAVLEQRLRRRRDRLCERGHDICGRLRVAESQTTNSVIANSFSSHAEWTAQPGTITVAYRIGKQAISSCCLHCPFFAVPVVLVARALCRDNDGGHYALLQESPGPATALLQWAPHPSLCCGAVRCSASAKQPPRTP